MSSNGLTTADRASRAQVAREPHSSHPSSTPALPIEKIEAHASHPGGLRVLLGQMGRFLLHLLEMTLAMMVGMGIFNVLLSAVLKPLGYTLASSSDAYLIGMAVSMVVPMAAWMRIRRMAWRPIAEMSTSMIALALVLVCAGYLGLLARSALIQLEHSLMVPAMLVPMLLRVRYYTGSHSAHQAHTA